MRRIVIVLLASGILALVSTSNFAKQQKNSAPDKASTGTPLKLVGKYDFPSSVTGRFDHLLVDLKTQRLFTTPQSIKGVMIFDLKTRELIRLRTGEGRIRAKARGVRMGRPPKLTPHQRNEALADLASGKASQADLARRFNVNESTISRPA